MKSDVPNHLLIKTINAQFTQALEHGKNTVRRWRTEYWNIKINKTKQALAIWCFYCRHKLKKLDITSLVTRANSLDITILPTMTIQKATDKIKELRQIVTEYHSNSKDMRLEALRVKVNLKEDTEVPKAVKALRQMMKAEKKSQVYQQVKNLESDHNIQGIVAVMTASSFSLQA